MAVDSVGLQFSVRLILESANSIHGPEDLDVHSCAVPFSFKASGSRKSQHAPAGAIRAEGCVLLLSGIKLSGPVALNPKP